MTRMQEETEAMFAEDGMIDAKIHGSSVIKPDLLFLDINTGYPEGVGRYTIRAVVKTDPETGEEFPALEFDTDEPPGAGADPYGRPDPIKHPEAWTE